MFKHLVPGRKLNRAMRPNQLRRNAAQSFGRRLMSGFAKLRPTQRLAFTTSLALVALLLIAVFTAHDGAAASAATPTQPVPAQLNSLPFIIGGNCTPPAAAGVTTVLDPIVSPFCGATTNWLTNGLNYAKYFFELLIGIEFAWSAILWLFQKEQLGELLASYILKVMGIMFFFMFISNASTWLPAIMQSFVGLGSTVTGTTYSLDPDVILNVGLGVCRGIFAAVPTPAWVTDPGFFGSNISNLLQTDITIAFSLLVTYVFAAVICFVVFIAFLIIAGQLIMTLVEMYIMIGAGAVMLGFTGSRWTMSFGEKYIGYCFAIGVKLFVNYIILALGVQLFNFSTGGCSTGSLGGSICGDLQMVHGTNLADITQLGNLVLAYLYVAVTTIIFMMLSMRIPGLAASMMNGSPSLTLGSAVSAAQSAVGAIQGTVGAVINTAQTVKTELGLAALDAAMLAAGAGGGGASGGGGGGMMGGAEGGGMMGGGDGDRDRDLMSSMGGGESGGGMSDPSQNIPVAGHLKNAAMAPIGGTFAAAQSALSPLLNMDEGGGGGSVGIGLKLPD